MSVIRDLRRFPRQSCERLRTSFLTIVGTTLAGATEDGCEEAVRFYRELGGKEEATILIHGGRIPAHDAAFVNAVMARALDFCDSMAPGPHLGAALIAGALAAAELIGGMSGRIFSRPLPSERGSSAAEPVGSSL